MTSRLLDGSALVSSTRSTTPTQHAGSGFSERRVTTISLQSLHARASAIEPADQPEADHAILLKAGAAFTSTMKSRKPSTNDWLFGADRHPQGCGIVLSRRSTSRVW